MCCCCDNCVRIAWTEKQNWDCFCRRWSFRISILFDRRKFLRVNHDDNKNWQQQANYWRWSKNGDITCRGSYIFYHFVNCRIKIRYRILNTYLTVQHKVEKQFHLGFKFIFCLFVSKSFNQCLIENLCIRSSCFSTQQCVCRKVCAKFLVFSFIYISVKNYFLYWFFHSW